MWTELVGERENSACWGHVFLIGDEWERNRLEWKFCGISFPGGIFPHAMDTSKT